MEPKPISPVIVTFKALPGVRVQALSAEGESPFCKGCALIYKAACWDDKAPKGDCIDRNYVWREVREK